MERLQVETPLVRWVDVGGGAVALGHRPKRKHLRDLPGAGATHVLTLLSEREGALEVRNATLAAGLTWLWLPLASGDPAKAPDVRPTLRQLRDVLLQGGRVFIHCAAGIHRTGMVTAALLHALGHDAVEVREILGELREVTRDGVGERRLAWAARLNDAR